MYSQAFDSGDISAGSFGQAPAPSPTQPLFGVVVPGRPLITDFISCSESKAITVLPAPGLVNEITFFLLPTTPIPEGYGAILYYAVPPFDSWELIGCVSPEKPSGTFRTGWPTKENVAGCEIVQLGVALEPLSTIHNLDIALSGVEERFAFAHKIALDLFQYMASFSTSAQEGMMVVPSKIFDSWFERFERKYRQDPNFFLK